MKRRCSQSSLLGAAARLAAERAVVVVHAAYHNLQSLTRGGGGGTLRAASGAPPCSLTDWPLRTKPALESNEKLRTPKVAASVSGQPSRGPPPHERVATAR